MIEALTIPSTFHYVVDSVLVYKDSPPQAMVNWELTKKYFEAEDDHEQCEGKPTRIYYCRLCGVKYSIEEIVKIFGKGE
jgi:hypothetical protein